MKKVLIILGVLIPLITFTGMLASCTGGHDSAIKISEPCSGDVFNSGIIVASDSMNLWSPGPTDGGIIALGEGQDGISVAEKSCNNKNEVKVAAAEKGLVRVAEISGIDGFLLAEKSCNYKNGVKDVEKPNDNVPTSNVALSGGVRVAEKSCNNKNEVKVAAAEKGGVRVAEKSCNNKNEVKVAEKIMDSTPKVAGGISEVHGVIISKSAIRGQKISANDRKSSCVACSGGIRVAERFKDGVPRTAAGNEDDWFKASAGDEQGLSEQGA